MPAVRRACV